MLRVAFLCLCYLFFTNSLAVADEGGSDFISSQNVIPGLYKERHVLGGAANAINAASISVDPHSGSLQIAHTDVFVPGDGGMDIKLARYYQTIQPNEEQTFQFDSNYDFSPIGLGWSMHFGMIKVSRPTAMCNTQTNANISDNPVYIAPDGSQRPLAIGNRAGVGGPQHGVVDSEYFTYVTKQFDVVYCKNFNDPLPSNDELWMRTADGRRYDFTSRYFNALYDAPAVWYVNKITDENGNWIKIDYSGSGVTGGEGVLIDKVTTSDGRVVNFSYNGAGSKGPTLESISYAGKTWSYSYEQSPVQSIYDNFENKGSTPFPRTV
ncbi:YD repeat-containing protein, partial [Alcanivorax hongdengensis A-11-3]